MVVRIDSFSGGLWTSEGAELTIPPNALVTADNIEYLPNGSIRGRRGRVKYNSVALPGSVLSLHRHYPRTGTPSLLAAFVNGSTVEIRHDTVGNGTFSTLSGGTGFAANKRWRFVTWPEKGATFLVNGSDNMRLYKSGALTDLGTEPRKGPYIALFGQRLFATDPNELNYAVYFSKESGDSDWDPNAVLNVSDRHGSQITGLAVFAGQLIVLKEGALWRWAGSGQPVQYSDIGCIAPDTVQVTPLGVMFVGRHGLYVTDGQDPNPLDLSRPIRALFVSRSTETVFSSAIGVYHPRKSQYVLKFSPANSDAYVLSHWQGADGLRFAWARNTALPMNCGTTWSGGTDSGELLIGDTTGQVWKVDSGITDGGAAFTPNLYTSSLLMHPDRFWGRVYQIFATYRGSAPLTVALRYNQATSDDLTISLGSSVATQVQRPQANITNIIKWGQYVSIGVTLPQDAYDTELYDLTAKLTFRGKRVR